MCTTRDDMGKKRARQLCLIDRLLLCAKRNQDPFKLSDPNASHAPSISLLDDDEQQAQFNIESL